MPTPIDKDALRALLDRFAATTIETARALGVDPCEGQIASGLINPSAQSSEFRIHPLRRQLSNHERLSFSTFTKARLEDIASLRKMIVSAIPALAHDDVYLVLELLSEEACVPRFRLHIGGFNLLEEFGSAEEITDRLLSLSEEISDLPHPGSWKLFRFGATTLPARGALAAARLYAALCPVRPAAPPAPEDFVEIRRAPA